MVLVGCLDLDWLVLVMTELSSQVSEKKKNKRGNVANFKGIKSPGRPKGKGNVIGGTMKQDMKNVYDRLGSADGLYKWCKRNPSNLSLFYRMMISLIPKNVQLDAHVTHSLGKLSDAELMEIIKKGEALDGSDVQDVVDLVPDYEG
jgi:hypothetical protein